MWQRVTYMTITYYYIRGPLYVIWRLLASVSTVISKTDQQLLVMWEQCVVERNHFIRYHFTRPNRPESSRCAGCASYWHHHTARVGVREKRKLSPDDKMNPRHHRAYARRLTKTRNTEYVSFRTWSTKGNNIRTSCRMEKGWWSLL